MSHRKPTRIEKSLFLEKCSYPKKCNRFCTLSNFLQKSDSNFVRKSFSGFSKLIGLIFRSEICNFFNLRNFSWTFQSKFLILGHQTFEKNSAIWKRPKVWAFLPSLLHPNSCKKIGHKKISEICFQSAFKNEKKLP